MRKNFICGMCADKGYWGKKGDIPERSCCMQDDGWIPVGSESHGLIREGEECPDCGAWYGRHHHLGCRYEQCPTCYGQYDTCEHGCAVNALSPKKMEQYRKEQELPGAVWYVHSNLKTQLAEEVDA